MPDLLIELFSEEIPARMQARAADDLRKLVTEGLVQAGLTYEGAIAHATPRRLVLAVQGLLAQSPTLREERKGPRVDAPEAAIDGFLRGAGLTRDQLEIRDEKKGQVYFAVVEKAGRPAAEIIAEVLEATIRTFPWPKSMRWGAGALRWVRPLHSIICLLSDHDGNTVVDLNVDGIVSGNTTRGHRFMAPDAVTVSNFDDYCAKLKRAYVVVDAAERADAIWQDATNQAFAAGLEVVEDRGLLAEVAGLVEWPVVLMGQIGEEFLNLPPEVLQTSMKEHQKFFSVKNPKTGRIERFITVANRETSDNGATILKGNQKVLSARLSDAKFFWENDLRTVKRQGMQAWVDQLSNVTFHNKLGSQKARIDRIAALARELAAVTGADADLAAQAAQVAKADLSSEMVYEFPELQGLMGRYYATEQGLPADVATACQKHYSPLGPSDEVPTEAVAVTVALADKIDTLTGFWAIEEFPTSSKDPFALRRAALGLFRLLKVNAHHIALDGIIRRAHQLILNQWNDENRLYFRVSKGDKLGFAPTSLHVSGRLVEDTMLGPVLTFDELALNDFVENSGQFSSISGADFVASDLLKFIQDRLKVFLRDQGVRHDVIDACLAMEGSDDLSRLVRRVEALQGFISSDDGENLIQGFKRANNILTQAEEKDGVEYSFGADLKFAESDEEKALFAALDAQEGKISAAMKAEDFSAAMAGLAALRAPIDGFFGAVQVNTDNQIVRRNRLNLLSRIRVLCLNVADLTRIEG